MLIGQITQVTDSKTNLKTSFGNFVVILHFFLTKCEIKPLNFEFEISNRLQNDL